MTASDLADAALEAIKSRGDRMTLTLPPSFKAPPGWPRGELLSVNGAGERNVSFDPEKLLAYAVREIRTGRA